MRASSRRKPRRRAKLRRKPRPLFGRRVKPRRKRSYQSIRGSAKARARRPPSKDEDDKDEEDDEGEEDAESEESADKDSDDEDEDSDNSEEPPAPPPRQDGPPPPPRRSDQPEAGDIIVGCRVRAVKSFDHSEGRSTAKTKVRKGMVGTVIAIDEDGDFEVHPGPTARSDWTAVEPLVFFLRCVACTSVHGLSRNFLYLPARRPSLTGWPTHRSANRWSVHLSVGQSVTHLLYYEKFKVTG